MTFCLAVMAADGLICLADGRLTAGSEKSIARKAKLHGDGKSAFCVMCSGLRSIRDKVVTYFDAPEANGRAPDYTRLTDVLTALSACIRRASDEDRDALERSGLQFDLHMIVAGRLAEDSAPAIYLLYPEGNWIAADERQPYLSIGTTAYAKSLLDMSIRENVRMAAALRFALAAFETTRLSTSDVGYPLDMMTFADDGVWRHRAFELDDLSELRQWWSASLPKLIQTMPADWCFEGLLPADAFRFAVKGSNPGDPRAARKPGRRVEVIRPAAADRSPKQKR